MRTIRKIIKTLVLFCLAIGIIGCSYLTCEGYDMYKTAIENEPIQEKIEEIRSRDNYTTIEELPQIYLNAIISVEDHRFYYHPGIDILSIARAAVNDIKAGSLVEGGSGITQQLCKNLYFTQEKKFSRKIAEIFLSFQFEKKYTKNEILELYVNSIFFGNNYYCVKDASLGYFGKLPKDMSAYESTLLAGIPNAPSAYALTKNPDLAHQRQKRVLEKMVKYKYLTEKEAQEIMHK